MCRSRTENNICKSDFKCISHRKVNYFDPLLDDPFETSLIFSKNFAYSYQNEYRIAFIPFDKNKTLAPTIIKIGDISYISEIVKII